MKTIALFINHDNKTASIEDSGIIKIYSKNSEYEFKWKLQNEFKFSLGNVKSARNSKILISDMINKLGKCDIFVAKKVIGQLYYLLELNNIQVYEIDEKVDQVLNIVENSEKIILKSTLEEAPKYKIPVPEISCDGTSSINLTKIMLEQPTLTSKNILLPFLKEKKFKILNIYCSHVPKWLNNFAEKNEMRIFEEKISNNEYKVKIHCNKNNKLITSFNTEYGILEKLITYNTYETGQLKDCMLHEKNELKTPIGLLIPQYEQNVVRRKYTNSLSYYKNGQLSKIALNDQTDIKTSVGNIPAELITFYKSGKIKRIFPLNGKLTGYWDENDEYSLAKEITLNLASGTFTAKIISLYFYESGEVKSITFWPNENVIINTPIGAQKIRIGISFYSNGKIKSFEPSTPVDIKTPIGKINAYDTSANGITGDNNSIKFTEDAQLESIVTSSNQVVVTLANNSKKVYSPEYQGNIDDDDLYYIPLKIAINRDIICFNNNDKYLIYQNKFSIENYFKPTKNTCTDCSNCNQCVG
ncbi:MAG: Fe-only nitrogenase accessory AnfO family protein [Clostridiales bacterium]